MATWINLNKTKFHHQYVFLSLLFFVIFPVRRAFSHNRVEERRSTSSIVPQTGSLIVRQLGTRPGEFPSIALAIQALDKLTGPQTIFIYPGDYTSNVHIKYGHPLTLVGYTPNRNTCSDNTVNVLVRTGRAQSGGDAESSGIWVNQNDFKMYNINVVNSYGIGTDTQAVALTAQGARHVYYMCLFSSYQDTLYVKTISAYFYGCIIRGSVDFIFGGGNAWFEKGSIVVRAPTSIATITAHKGTGDTRFVFNHSNVLPAHGVKPSVAFLGRPWSPYAAVTFQYCWLSGVINPAGWKPWSTSASTQFTQFYEYQNQGPGSGTNRQIGKTASQPLQLEQVLGGDYATWIS